MPTNTQRGVSVFAYVAVLGLFTGTDWYKIQNSLQEE